MLVVKICQPTRLLKMRMLIVDKSQLYQHTLRNIARDSKLPSGFSSIVSLPVIESVYL